MACNRSLCDKFNYCNYSLDDFLTNEETAKLEKQLAGLAGMVKSGKYVVEATEHSELSEPTFTQQNIHLLVTVKPSESYASAAPVKSMEFLFHHSGFYGDTHICYTIQTAEKSAVDQFPVHRPDFWGHRAGGIPEFVKASAKLGLAKIKRSQWPYPVSNPLQPLKLPPV